MHKKDKEFFINKNKLDASYNKILTLFEVSIIVLATLIISLSIFLFQQNMLNELGNFVIIGIIFAGVILIIAGDRLKDIENEIDKLK